MPEFLDIRRFYGKQLFRFKLQRVKQIRNISDFMKIIEGRFQ